MSIFTRHWKAEFRKRLFYAVFTFIKHFKYRGCVIKTNHIHPSVQLGRHVIIERGGRISRGVIVGSYTYFNEHVRIDSNTQSIGSYCSLSHNVKVGLGPHPATHVSTSAAFYSRNWGFVDHDTYDEVVAKGRTVIENDVLIGANAVVLAGVRVGTGAIIGAGSVVTHDVAPYTVVGGAPAVKLRDRFDERTKARLLATRWWEHPPEALLGRFPMDDPQAFLAEWDSCALAAAAAAPELQARP